MEEVNVDVKRNSSSEEEGLKVEKFSSDLPKTDDSLDLPNKN